MNMTAQGFQPRRTELQPFTGKDLEVIVPQAFWFSAPLPLPRVPGEERCGIFRHGWLQIVLVYTGNVYGKYCKILMSE